jgi:site-specific recombinase XerD
MTAMANTSVGTWSRDKTDFLIAIAGTENQKNAVILQTLFETGCEVQELTRIKIKNIEFAKTTTDLNKIEFENKNARKSAISQDLAEKLQRTIRKKQRKEDEYLFSQQPKKPLSVERVEQIIKETIRKNISPKTIRYYHIIHAYEQGLNIDSISSQTGLKKQRILQISENLNLDSTQSYSKFFEQTINSEESK